MADPTYTTDVGVDKYWSLTSRDDVFLAIALGAVSPTEIAKLIPPVITNTREWLLYMAGADPETLNGYYDGNGDGLTIGGQEQPNKT